MTVLCFSLGGCARCSYTNIDTNSEPAKSDVKLEHLSPDSSSQLTGVSPFTGCYVVTNKPTSGTGKHDTGETSHAARFHKKTGSLSGCNTSPMGVTYVIATSSDVIHLHSSMLV